VRTLPSSLNVWSRYPVETAAAAGWTTIGSIASASTPTATVRNEIFIRNDSLERFGASGETAEAIGDEA